MTSSIELVFFARVREERRELACARSFERARVEDDGGFSLGDIRFWIMSQILMGKQEEWQPISVSMQGEANP
jgi:hypothetical protein